MNKIIKNALFDAIGTALYIVFIASFMFYLQGTLPKEDSFFAPIAMLLLFVFSAAFTGLLVFGKPIIWYLDGKKKDALALIAWTLGILFVITIMVFILLVMYKG